jgi:alkylation response protein AidB-like acyl-CoA dehydrogenase
MMGTVLPWFSVLNASGSVGMMDGAITRAAAHVNATRFAHLGTSIADLPTARAPAMAAMVSSSSTAALSAWILARAM